MRVIFVLLVCVCIVPAAVTDTSALSPTPDEPVREAIDANVYVHMTDEQLKSIIDATNVIGSPNTIAMLDGFRGIINEAAKLMKVVPIDDLLEAIVYAIQAWKLLIACLWFDMCILLLLWRIWHRTGKLNTEIRRTRDALTALIQSKTIEHEPGPRLPVLEDWVAVPKTKST